MQLRNTTVGSRSSQDARQRNEPNENSPELAFFRQLSAQLTQQEDRSNELSLLCREMMHQNQQAFQDLNHTQKLSATLLAQLVQQLAPATSGANQQVQSAAVGQVAANVSVYSTPQNQRVQTVSVNSGNSTGDSTVFNTGLSQHEEAEDKADDDDDDNDEDDNNDGSVHGVSQDTTLHLQPQQQQNSSSVAVASEYSLFGIQHHTVSSNGLHSGVSSGHNAWQNNSHPISNTPTPLYHTPMPGTQQRPTDGQNRPHSIVGGYLSPNYSRQNNPVGGGNNHDSAAGGGPGDFSGHSHGNGSGSNGSGGNGSRRGGGDGGGDPPFPVAPSPALPQPPPQRGNNTMTLAKDPLENYSLKKLTTSSVIQFRNNMMIAAQSQVGAARSYTSYTSVEVQRDLIGHLQGHPAKFPGFSFSGSVLLTTNDETWALMLSFIAPASRASFLKLLRQIPNTEDRKEASDLLSMIARAREFIPRVLDRIVLLADSVERNPYIVPLLKSSKGDRGLVETVTDIADGQDIGIIGQLINSQEVRARGRAVTIQDVLTFVQFCLTNIYDQEKLLLEQRARLDNRVPNPHAVMYKERSAGTSQGTRGIGFRTGNASSGFSRSQQQPTAPRQFLPRSQSNQPSRPPQNALSLLLRDRTGAEFDEFGDGRGCDLDNYDVDYEEQDETDEELSPSHQSRLSVDNTQDENPTQEDLVADQRLQQLMDVGEHAFLALLSRQDTVDDPSPGGCMAALLDKNGQCHKGTSCRFKHDQATQQRTLEYFMRRLNRSVYRQQNGKSLSGLQGAEGQQPSQRPPG